MKYVAKQLHTNVDIFFQDFKTEAKKMCAIICHIKYCLEFVICLLNINPFQLFYFVNV